jgi:predicted transcriptional regulator
MTREDKLRKQILDSYVSLRQFAMETDIPYSTLMTLLSRSVGGASFDVMIQICRKLEINPLDL